MYIHTNMYTQLICYLYIVYKQPVIWIAHMQKPWFSLTWGWELAMPLMTIPLVWTHCTSCVTLLAIYPNILYPSMCMYIYIYVYN